MGAVRFFVFASFSRLASFWGESCFIFFGATEKELGYPRFWNCSPFLHRHTNVDQLDSGIAVHSTGKHQQARVSDDSGLPGVQQTSCKFVHKSEARRTNKKRDAPCILFESASQFNNIGFPIVPCTFSQWHEEIFACTLLLKAQGLCSQLCTHRDERQEHRPTGLHHLSCKVSPQATDGGLDPCGPPSLILFFPNYEHTHTHTHNAHLAHAHNAHTTHTTPHLAPRVDHSKCVAHTALACMTCKRLRKSAEECCKLGHHAASHVARRPQLQLCPLHNLPPCPRCTLKQRGVRHYCDRGHHKVCTPVPAHRKRTLPMQSLLPHKKPCLQRPARHSSGLLRSPHQPPTPPAPKRRRPKTPLIQCAENSSAKLHSAEKKSQK